MISSCSGYAWSNTTSSCLLLNTTHKAWIRPGRYPIKVKIRLIQKSLSSPLCTNTANGGKIIANMTKRTFSRTSSTVTILICSIWYHRRLFWRNDVLESKKILIIRWFFWDKFWFLKKACIASPITMKTIPLGSMRMVLIRHDKNWGELSDTSLTWRNSTGKKKPNQTF